MRATDNKCSASIISAGWKKRNNCQRYKKWQWYYIDSAAFKVINHGFLYFSTAAPKAWNIQLDHPQRTQLVYML